MNHTKHLSIKDFNDLKQKAYIAAQEGIKANFGKEWKDEFIGGYSPSTVVRQYEKVIGAYKDYLLKLKTKEEAKKVIDDIEKKYDNFEEMLDKTFSFMKAEEKAFSEQESEFGEVSFICPICGGKAWATRYHTPENIAHKVTVRSGCEKCGYRCMN